MLFAKPIVVHLAVLMLPHV